MTNKIAWPKEVPVLTAKDMCQKLYFNTNKTAYCLAGWHMKIFTGANQQAYNALQKAAKTTQGIVNFNDNNTLKHNAEVWNEAMEDLGYTEDA